MRPKLTFLLALSTLLVPSVVMRAQNEEATATPTVPSLNRAPEPGQIDYQLGLSQAILFGYNGQSGASTSTDISGSASYISGSQDHPFSAIYSGGYMFGENSGQPSASFQNLGLSQEYIAKHFNFVVGDLVSYLPEAPIFGLSGIPGVGDIGTQPIGAAGVPLDSILSYYGRRVTNTASGSVTVKFSPSTDINGYAAYTVQRFIDNVGIDNNELDSGADIEHRLNVRNTIGAGYVNSYFTYLPGSAFAAYVPANFSFTTQEVDVQYEHVFTRRLIFNGDIGPQWSTSSDSSYMPSETSVGVNAVLSYTERLTQYQLSYSRGVSAGGGVLAGTIGDNVNFTTSHRFTRQWQGSFSANYGHADSLAQISGISSDATTFYMGVQANRAIGRYFSAYASYNYEWQSTSGYLLTPLAYNGSTNVVGFGIFYTPRPLHVHHD